jgi:hypothetical protein
MLCRRYFYFISREGEYTVGAAQPPPFINLAKVADGSKKPCKFTHQTFFLKKTENTKSIIVGYWTNSIKMPLWSFIVDITGNRTFSSKDKFVGFSA